MRIEEWHQANRSFTGLAGSYFENMTETSGALPERVAAMRTSPRFFTVLGVFAALGLLAAVALAAALIPARRAAAVDPMRAMREE